MELSNVDFTWTFHNYKLEEQPEESGEGEIYGGYLHIIIY